MKVVLKKIVFLIKDLWLISAITLTLLVLIEVAASYYFNSKAKTVVAGSPKPYQADAYDESFIVEKYFEEDISNFWREYTRWEPYVHWKHSQYMSNYLNVSSDGLRKTWNEIEGSANHPKIRIFMFGASTMFGLGEVDDFTIPSLVSKHLHAKGINAEVSNFGKLAYSSTQELNLLISELKKGNMPDIVIFMDGYNDVSIANFFKDPATIAFNEYLKEGFEYGFSLEQGSSLTFLLKSLLSQTNFAKLVSSISEKGRGKKVENSGEDVINKFFLIDDSKLNSHEVDRVAKELVTNYENNIEIIKTLSIHYGFEALFYWQPTIFEKKELSEFEKSWKNTPFMEGLEDLYAKVNEILRSSQSIGGGRDSFHDIGGLFFNISKPLFIDFAHTERTGNEYIALRMLTDIIPFCNSQSLLEKRASE